MKRLTLLTIVAASFLASWLVLRTTMHHNRVAEGKAEFSVKMTWLRDQRSDVQVVFIGNSLVYRQLAPDVFDAELAALGLPMKSFNLGILGQTLFEMEEMIRDLCDSRHPALRYVVVQIFKYSAPWPENLLSSRVISFHDLRGMMSTTRYYMDVLGPSYPKLSTYPRHLLPFLYNIANVGVVSALFDARALDEHANMTILGPNKDGFYSLDDTVKFERSNSVRRINERNRNYVANRVMYENIRSKGKGARISGAEMGFLERIVTCLKKSNLEVLYFVPPDHERLATDNLPASPIISFNNDRYPELYDASSRWDERHLNLRGSGLLSKYLAREFAEAVRRSSHAPAPAGTSR